MSKQAQSKKEQRRLARQQRKAEEAERQRRRRRRRTLIVGAAGLVVVAAVAFGVWVSMRPESAATVAGPAVPSGQSRPEIVSAPDQGRDHVGPGQPHPPYNSNPPTSGWHYGTTAPWGFHNTALPDELIIHNLEHGGIWISYKDENDSEVVDALVALARQFPRKVIMTHRSANDTRLAVAAWGRLMKLERFDRDAIVDFINRFKNKGPELVPD